MRLLNQGQGGKQAQGRPEEVAGLVDLPKPGGWWCLAGLCALVPLGHISHSPINVHVCNMVVLSFS